MQGQIHPTAIIDPAAQIDASVSIGPYTVIGPHVKIGAGTTVGPHCVIEGHTTIGRDNRTSFYDEQAIERVRLVRRLMDELGVNLPGAEVILHMRERTLTLIDELERLRRQRP